MTPIIGKLSQSKTSRRYHKHFQKFSNIPKFKGTHYGPTTVMSDFMMFSVIIKLKQTDMCGPPNQKKKKNQLSLAQS